MRTASRTSRTSTVSTFTPRASKTTTLFPWSDWPTPKKLVLQKKPLRLHRTL